MTLFRSLAFYVLLTCCLVAEVCVAETPIVSAPESSQKGSAPGLEKARKHFLQGIQFYNAGDYKISLIEFRRSYEISRNYRILYNIGQVNQQLGNYTNAMMALEEYLRESGDDVGEERRAEVLASILTLRARVAHIRIVSNVDAPEVLIDGFPATTKNSNGDIIVDPGDHRIDLRKAGYQNNGTVVALAAGDTSSVRIDLVRIPIATQTITRGYRQPSHGDTTWLWIGWTTTAATALGAGVTGVLALTQANELADLRNTPGSTQAQRDDARGRAKAFALTSDVLAIAALAAGTTSLYLTLSRDKSAPEQRAKPVTRLGFTPGGLRFERTF